MYCNGHDTEFTENGQIHCTRFQSALLNQGLPFASLAALIARYSKMPEFLTTGQWDEWLCRLFNVPEAMLPEVRPSSGVQALGRRFQPCTQLAAL